MAVLVYKDARLCTADGDLAVHRFERAAGTSPNGAVVVVFHGYGAHAHFPTVRYAAEVLAAAGNVVYCLDFPGHGASPGTCGLVRSSEQLTTIGRAMARWATEQQPDRALALFGSSMGGAIALNVCRREPDIVATVVVAAPMLGIAPASLPRSGSRTSSGGWRGWPRPPHCFRRRTRPTWPSSTATRCGERSARRTSSHTRAGCGSAAPAPASRQSGNSTVVLDWPIFSRISPLSAASAMLYLAPMLN